MSEKRRRQAEGPRLVLVGRPNVGKSTLFNKITGTRRSIVTPIAGTTRDEISGQAEWAGRRFTVVDTGGMFGASEDPLHELVFAHGLKALRSADVVVVVVDGKEGLVGGDQDVAQQARRSGAPVLVAVNKIDAKGAARNVDEFRRLGFDRIFVTSAEHGTGLGDLLDAALTVVRTPAAPETEPAPEEIRVAIVGRPNVGKSSLVNRLVREERVVVSDMPGTTRDAIDVVLTWHGRTIRFVDTAGIRRAGRVAASGPLESLSVIVARRAIAHADVAVLVIDSEEGATDQDATVAGEAERDGCGVIIAANKWDLVKQPNPEFAKAFDEKLRRQLKFLDFAAVLHVSALTGERATKLFDEIVRVWQARRRRVPTGELNRFIQRITTENPPVSKGKHEVRVLYASQAGIEPPTFVLFTNVATSFHFSYERYIINRLRQAYDFAGTPIRIKVRRRTRAAAEEK